MADVSQAPKSGSGKMVVLGGRGVIALGGEDARAFLQGIVTNDIQKLGTASALHTGLLSPQGKILFAFFVLDGGERLIIDGPEADHPALMKRLQMYRLRARVSIEDASEAYAAVAGWDGAAPAAAVAGSDPRLAELGWRGVVMREQLAEALKSHDAAVEADYDARRIAYGVPEAGRDYETGDTFPHDALFDQLGSVSFTKGCYVGQEVVSRMEHRGTARKRIVPFVAEEEVQSGEPVMAGEVAIGRTGTVQGSAGLAMVRLDRAADAYAKGRKLSVSGVPIRLRRPEWATFEVPQPAG